MRLSKLLLAGTSVTALSTLVFPATANAGAFFAGNYVVLLLLLNTLPGVNQLGLVQASLAGATTQQQYSQRLEAISPTVDGGAMTGALSVTNNTMSLTNDRLASLRGGETGVATGSQINGLRAWGQLFGQTGEHDARDGVQGFDVDGWGFAAGVDTENLGENVVIGLALSYADTEVDSANANNTQTSMDTVQVTLYGDYDIDRRTFVSGQIAYAWSDIKQSRYAIGGVAGLNADAGYNASTYSAEAEIGRNYYRDNLTIIPAISANWTQFRPDTYTETGAGNVNQTVDGDPVDSLELGIGSEFSWKFQRQDGSYFTPAIHAGYAYDVIGDEVEVTGRFAGGGSAFAVQGWDPARHRFDIGSSVTYYSNDNWELSADYNLRLQSDYELHSGFLRATYRF